MNPIDILIKNNKDNDWSFLEEIHVPKDLMIKAVKVNPKNILYIFPKLKYFEDIEHLLTANPDILPYVKQFKTFQKYFSELIKIVETDYDPELVNKYILEKKQNILFLPYHVQTVENIEKVIKKFGQNRYKLGKDFYSQLQIDQDKLNQLVACGSLVPLFILKFDLFDELEFDIDYLKEILRDNDNEKIHVVATILFEIYSNGSNIDSKHKAFKTLFGDFIDDFNKYSDIKHLDFDTQVKIAKRYAKYIGHMKLNKNIIKQIKTEHNVIARMTFYGYVGDSSCKYYDCSPGTLYNLNGLLNQYIDNYDYDYDSYIDYPFQDFQNEQCDDFNVEFTKEDIKKLLKESKLSKKDILEMFD